jgi:hypothetical protein
MTDEIPEQDDIDQPEKKEDKSEADKLYQQLSSVHPERESVVPKGEIEFDEGIKSQTLSQRMETSRNPSDMQVAIARLLPDLVKKWLNVLQISRVFPDVYNHYFIIFIKELMRGDKDMTLGEAIAYVSTSLSIAIDGEGRIDIITMFGRAATLESEKAKTTMGL